MRCEPKDPPRTFEVGDDHRITLSHVLDLELAPDEQVTILTGVGHEVDVVRKDWGFYALPSVDGRLKSFDLRTCLVGSRGRRYVLLVEAGKEADFYAYLKKQRMRILFWLDGEEPVSAPSPEEVAMGVAEASGE